MPVIIVILSSTGFSMRKRFYWEPGVKTNNKKLPYGSAWNWVHWKSDVWIVKSLLLKLRQTVLLFNRLFVVMVSYDALEARPGPNQSSALLLSFCLHVRTHLVNEVFLVSVTFKGVETNNDSFFHQLNNLSQISYQREQVGLMIDLW